MRGAPGWRGKIYNISKEEFVCFIFLKSEVGDGHNERYSPAEAASYGGEDSSTRPQ
jgi:hypothetical protein